MSVISSVPTVEGFVIGSDGRKTNSDAVISDDTQKIFSIDLRSAKLAYGLFGTITIGQATDRVLFDFQSAIPDAIEELGNAPGNFWEFMNALTASLTERLNKAREASRDTFSRDDLGTHICIGGVYGKFLKLGHIAFSHGIERTAAEAKIYPPGFSFPFGSIKVFELINGGDPRFAAYAQPSRFGLTTLAAGIARVRNDILSHYDPEALAIDGPSCRGVGGRVQIGTVTFGEGFRWVPGFEPLNRAETTA